MSYRRKRRRFKIRQLNRHSEREIPSALSVATLREPPRVTPVTNPARESSRRGPLWTVQVASLNQTRDAEVAGKLKGKGYDAYVVAAEVKSKLWHRVRVGQEVILVKPLSFERDSRPKRILTKHLSRSDS